MHLDERSCKSCKWHDDFSWVCFNGNSEYRADFTDDKQACAEWEAKENETTE